MAGIRETTRTDHKPELAVQRSRERDELQQAIDTKVADVVNGWIRAGRPDDGSVFGNFETDDTAEAKRRVRRGFSLVNGILKEATPEGERKSYVNLAPMWYKDSEPDADGWIVIQFSVRHVAAGEKPENGETQPEQPEQPEQHSRRNRHSEGE